MIGRYFPWLGRSARLQGLDAGFRLGSTSLEDGAAMPLDHVAAGGGGGNRSPDLYWRNAPAGTRSFAVTAFDPDAPTGSGWWHWIVVNIPATVSALPVNAGDPAGELIPGGASQALGDGNQPKAGYSGACPPVGDKPHRYVFSVIALSADRIVSGPAATPASTAFQINKYAIGRASLTVHFGRT